ncbi:MAG: 4-hydroxy-tetrahydrodipicolinate synthase [Flavobacteriaceae bacterium]|nr:4-hydroxy-tetrahydrodipicolinate synthase [Flavobacteriaceae bacterium]
MNFLKGTGVAIITPFKNNGEIDFNAYQLLIDYYINNNINYLVILGTTGESNTISFEEKNKIFENVVKFNSGRVPLIIGLGGNDTQNLVSQISNYDLKNFNAILSVCPYYNKPTQIGLYEHFYHVSKASKIPIILYDVPSRTGVSISNKTILKLLKNCKNIVGIKDATGDIKKGIDLIKNTSRSFHVISGDDLTAVDLVLNGGSGVISVVAGAFPMEFSKIITLAKKNKTKEAKERFNKIKNIIGLLFKEGNPAGIKAFLSIKGYCENILRLPLTPVDKNLYDDIKEKIKIFSKKLS